MLIVDNVTTCLKSAVINEATSPHLSLALKVSEYIEITPCRACDDPNLLLIMMHYLALIRVFEAAIDSCG
jgi:hypothetical protein